MNKRDRRIIALRKHGYVYREIAEQVGVTATTVGTVVRRHNIERGFRSFEDVQRAFQRMDDRQRDLAGRMTQLTPNPEWDAVSIRNGLMSELDGIYHRLKQIEAELWPVDSPPDQHKSLQ